jgi:hypothetical protein
MADEAGRKRTLIWVFVGVIAFACVAVVAGGALFVLGMPTVANAVERAEASYCQQRLRSVYQHAIQHRIESGRGFSDLGTAIALASDSPSAYAVRDLEAFPLAATGFDAAEPLLACNGNARPKHPPELHVLYADGGVRTLTLQELKADGVVPPDTDVVFAGPDSPVPDLRKLRRP